MTDVTAPGSDDLVLAAEFPAVTRQQWQRLVAKVLRVDADVESPERRLATITADGIAAGDAEIIADEISRQVRSGLASGVAALYPQLA